MNTEIIIAVVSLILSLFTLWISYLHQGGIRMTRPTIVAFAHEGMRREQPKVFLRTLLSCTSKQGRIVETLYLKISNRESAHTFSVWAYGDSAIVRGSGIYVGEQGVEVYHHFIAPKSLKGYTFLSGKYTIEIWAVVKSKKRKLYSLELYLPEETTTILNNGVLGVFFDWNPELSEYVPYIEDPTNEKMGRLLS